MDIAVEGSIWPAVSSIIGWVSTYIFTVHNNIHDCKVLLFSVVIQFLSPSHFELEEGKVS